MLDDGAWPKFFRSCLEGPSDEITDILATDPFVEWLANAWEKSPKDMLRGVSRDAATLVLDWHNFTHRKADLVTVNYLIKHMSAHCMTWHAIGIEPRLVLE